MESFLLRQWNLGRREFWRRRLWQNDAGIDKDYYEWTILQIFVVFETLDNA